MGGGGNGKGGGKNRGHGGGRKKNHGRMGGGGGDEDSYDGLGGRGSPESELKSLVAAAKASRARLSAPLPSSSSPSNSSFSFNNNPLSAVPSSFRTGGGPLATFGGMGGGTLMGGIPREGWKGSLYGRRRDNLRGLDRSLRDALGVK